MTIVCHVQTDNTCVNVTTDQDNLQYLPGIHERKMSTSYSSITLAVVTLSTVTPSNIHIIKVSSGDDRVLTKFLDSDMDDLQMLNKLGIIHSLSYFHIKFRNYWI